MLRFRAFRLRFFCTFWNFMLLFGIFCTIWVFWAFYAVLSQIIFVVIYALLRVKLFWLNPCSCKKVVFLHLCGCESLSVKLWVCNAASPWSQSPNMQFVTNFTRIKFQNNFLPKKRVNYNKLRFPTT